jgi:hypothetical protein
LFSVFTFQSCEDPAPDCEIYDYGTVIVKNETGFKIEVDVTWGNIDINSERIVSNNSSTTYREIPAGKIYLWVSILYDGYWMPWEYKTEYLITCDELTYKWYMSGKKSTLNDLSLDIIQDGKVIKTITEFNTVTKYKN